MPRPDAERTLDDTLTQARKARPEVLDGYLFGSTATGTAGAHSDVDVAVYVEPEALKTAGGYGYEAALTTALMAALGRNDVDVVVLNRATPLLYHRVLRDGRRVLSRDLRETTTREGYALSRYCDDLHRLDIIDRTLRSQSS